ncbi:MAG: 5'-nucleotidase [Bacteroidetes bacterium]|nr:MAG: 5'-nucleotidase [Bacteroidota bacterium]
MAKSKPLILVTNDDGFYASGLHALIDAVKELGDVFVVAPDRPQSGMGHAITINSTLRVSRMHHFGVAGEYTCSGTPVDCVKMAVNKLLPRKPDLCVSGINHGANHSINIIYSGTMSAAVESAIEGIPSLGLSLLDYSLEADFTAAAHYSTKLARRVLESGLPAGVCLNVNIPKLPAEKLKGIKVCRQAYGTWVEELDERTDPAGRTYFWLTGAFKNFEEGAEDTDAWALSNGYVSVVPVQFDMTAHKALAGLKDIEN